jgi:hypothetical protein
MTPLTDILTASAAQWFRGLLTANASGVGTALAGIVVDMGVHTILTMTAIQALVHIGLYLQHPAGAAKDQK